MTKLLSQRWFVFIVTALAHAVATRGRPLAAGDTALYTKLAHDFAAGQFGGTFNIWSVRWTKTVVVALIAAAQAISPPHWMGLMVAVNVICSGLLAVMLLEVVRLCCRTDVALASGLVLYIGCFEIVQWVPRVLTDVPYCATSFAPFLLVVRRLLLPDEPPRRLLLGGALLLAAFTRPPGIVLVFLVAFVELVLISRRVSARAATTAILVCAAAALIVRSAIVHDPSLWPFRFVRPKLVEFAGREKTGEVMYDRKESFHRPPRTAADHALIVVDRTVRIFQVAAPSFSPAHKAVNYGYFLTVYAFGMYAAVEAFRGNDRRRRALVVTVLVWLGVYAYFYGLTILDYDWRFRAPLMPHLIVLAACGIDLIARRSFRHDAAPAV